MTMEKEIIRSQIMEINRKEAIERELLTGN